MTLKTDDYEKNVFVIVAFLMSVMLLNAENVKTVKLSFNKEQFSFIKDEVGATEIVSHDIDFGIGSDSAQPGLPLMSVNVWVPNGVEFDGISEVVDEQLLFEDIIVAANPICLPTNYDGILPKKALPIYSQSVYPKNKVQYVCTSKMDGYTVLRFLVCPFEYDVQGKKLYIAKNVAFDINLKDSPSAYSFDSLGIGNNMKDIVMDQITNADELKAQEISTQSVGFADEETNVVSEKYIILTSKNLAPYFKPLASWKTTKGIKTEIVTVEDITEARPDMDAPLAIKTFLKGQYIFNKLKYVLLGGDDYVVPVRDCHAVVDDTIVENHMPTDLYYACFERNFEWDYNKNGVYGERADSISLDPSIFVTRIPVRSPEDVAAFVKKTIDYEKNPNVANSGNRILMAGAQLFGMIDGTSQSDSEAKGEYFYEKHMHPYWDGERKQFYDTNTDFQGGACYDVTADNLQYQMSQGYSFVDMIAHGNSTAWGIEKNNFYTTKDAEKLNNEGHSIVTTIACLTNAFDSVDEPCLSESFIRNPNSGIVAYLGCSRSGWETINSAWSGPSLAYEVRFYQKLFDTNVKNKNYGVVVAMAKNSFAGRSKHPNPIRWLQFGLNPIGDPEMPIYTATPKLFSKVSVQSGLDNKIVIDTGVDSCNVCLMSKEDEGETDYQSFRNIRSIVIPLKATSTICITKQNYIPYVMTATPNSEDVADSKIQCCAFSPSGNKLLVSTELVGFVLNSHIIVSSSSGNKQVVYDVSKENPTVDIDLYDFPKGVLTVSLNVNGKIVDTRNIIRK